MSADTPYRPIPADFVGPICVECKHMRMTPTNRYSGPRLDYECAGYEPELVRPAERNPITGEIYKARYRYVECREKNDRGQCDRFEAKPESTQLVRIDTRTPPRRAAAWLGARLVAWSNEGEK